MGASATSSSTANAPCVRLNPSSHERFPAVREHDRVTRFDVRRAMLDTVPRSSPFVSWRRESGTRWRGRGASKGIEAILWPGLRGVLLSPPLGEDWVAGSATFLATRASRRRIEAWFRRGRLTHVRQIGPCGNKGSFLGVFPGTPGGLRGGLARHVAPLVLSDGAGGACPQPASRLVASRARSPVSSAQLHGARAVRRPVAAARAERLSCARRHGTTTSCILAAHNGWYRSRSTSPTRS